jgi:hypothetical protein
LHRISAKFERGRERLFEEYCDILDQRINDVSFKSRSEIYVWYYWYIPTGYNNVYSVCLKRKEYIVFRLIFIERLRGKYEIFNEVIDFNCRK